ncbi:non-ribosomal peptide synthetase, partial [Pantoea sp. Ap-967]|uniref:condensation domain-containing protein n=1 Tax=Pantoea sp. Ap-967 TaxID=2608362 RepID=UPI00351B5716|nr:non-ribosomal peptide synthetase [Pantoea sp. Ap-967]
MRELIESVGALPLKERKALAVLLKQKGINLFAVAPIFKRDPAEPLQLSYAQERQWFLWQLDPSSTAYHIPVALRLRGALDVPALERAFQGVVARHEALRTTLLEGPHGALQQIHESSPVDLQVEPFEPLTGLDLEASLRARIEAETQQLFDLAQGPLYRLRLWGMGEDDHVLVLTLHHIVADGWSMQVMVDDLTRLYAEFAHGLPANLPPLPIQYADYALWQRHWMEAGERERQQAFWLEQLGGEQPVLALPLDYPRPAEQRFQGARLDVQVPAALSQRLLDLARSHGVTPFMLLLASFQLLLHRHSGQVDIRVGVPVANRNRVETEGLIGFFVNTQVLKAEIDDQQRFDQFLSYTRQQVLAAQAHQDLPFEQLVEVLQPERNLSYSPLFQVLFNHKGAALPSAEPASQGPLQIQQLSWLGQSAQFDLSLDTYERADGIGAALTYATDLFNAATAERLGRHWLNLLQSIVAMPQARLCELPMLDSDERTQLLERFNATATPYDLNQTVHGLFEQRVQATPDAPALLFGEQQLSYAE